MFGREAMAVKSRFIPILLVVLLALSGCGRAGTDTTIVCGDCGCHGGTSGNDVDYGGDSAPGESADGYDIIVIIVIIIVIIIIIVMLSQSGEG